MSLSNRIIRSFRVAGVAVCALALTSCGSGEPAESPATDPPPVPTASPEPDPTERGESDDLAVDCTNSDGFAVSYPQDWITNEEPAGELPPCSLFDPHSVDTGDHQEVPTDIAVFMRIDPVAFEPEPDPEHVTELDRQTLTVDGRDALRLELEHTGAGLLPEGAPSTGYRVDLGEQTFVATTHDVGEPAYAEAQEVLDAMVDTVRFTEPADGQPEDAAWRECTDPESGYSLSYPADWHTNEEEVDHVSPCSLFDPDPDQLRTEGMEVPLDIAVTAHLEAAPFDDVATPGAHAEQLDRREDTVDGRAALRLEHRETGEGLYPEGTTLTRWLVDLDGLTFVARTTDVGAHDYAATQEVLDEMVASATFEDEVPVGCSADDLDAELAPQEELPAEVADVRAEIAAAAVDCDYQRLARLAGDDFTFSFGVDDAPAAHWRRQEAGGGEPMRHLVGVLDLPHGVVDDPQPRQYVWPSAFAHESWAEVPERDREALGPLYHEEDLRRFEELGGYLGYRVGIDADGTWLFFVAGD